MMTYDMIIVGGGPAGLTAAIYACRASKRVLVLEGKGVGGQIVNTPDIENYPTQAHISGFDFAMRLYEQAQGLGAEIRFEKAVGMEDKGEIKVVSTAENAYEGRSVILATGSVNRKLGLAGEDDYIGKGISYCATCDGNFFRKKVVAVVGGGNTALEDALYLSGLATKVYLIHRRDSFRGDEATAARLREKDNVEFVLNSTVSAIIADKRLNAVEVINKSGEKRTLEIDGLFVAVGRAPENQIFAQFLDLDGTGCAIAGEDCRTKTPGVFVAGDNRQKDVRQLVTAVSDGAVAATGAVRYLEQREEKKV